MKISKDDPLMAVYVLSFVFGGLTALIAIENLDWTSRQRMPGYTFWRQWRRACWLDLEKFVVLPVVFLALYLFILGVVTEVEG